MLYTCAKVRMTTIKYENSISQDAVYRARNTTTKRNGCEKYTDIDIVLFTGWRYAFPLNVCIRFFKFSPPNPLVCAGGDRIACSFGAKPIFVNLTFLA